MKKRIHIFIFAIAILLLTLKTDVYAESIAISQSKATMNIGEQIDLDITGTDKTVKWLSYNENTVSVDENGIITALRTGKTTIRARVGFWYKTCSVNVVKPSIKVNKTSATIYHGGTSTNTVQLKAAIKGATKNIVWISSNESVATVDSKGKVTSVSEGTATITATANTVSATCKITVKESGISLNLKEMQLSTKGVGSSIKLTPSITGSNKKVKWATSDKSVASVSGGKVTGKNTGTATITATANGVSASCNITVVKGLISINEENVVLYAGETKQLKSNASKKEIINWRSSNENVVTVENGKLTAKQAGIAVISIESDGVTDSCVVTVKDTATSIAEDEVSLKTKGTEKIYNLNCNVIGRTSSIKWTSSNNKIATVNKGKITAKKAGTVTITATANGVSDSVNVVVCDFEPTIVLNQNTYTLYTKKGNTITLKATVDGSDKKVTYTSSNPDCATVSGKGKVTALKAGETLITATSNGVSAQCMITVKETSVVLEKENLLMKKGDSQTLGVDIIGKSQNVKWSTSNKKVATVKNGKITAKANGEADITVTANGIKSICHVKVSECIHSFDEGTNVIEPTCGKSGIIKYICTMCDYFYKESVPALEHEYIETKREESTCTSYGYVLYECKNCMDTKQEQLLSLDHIWDDGVITKAPTCEIEGEKTITCSLCLYSYTEPISIINHEYIEVSKEEADCEKDGFIIYKCKTCESSYSEILTATGHSFNQWTVTKEATEEEEGVEERICSNCQEKETRSIDKLEHIHSYESVVTAPTCTEEGYTTYTCKCGKTYTGEYTFKTGHSYGDWVTTKEPTETEEGIREATCSGCGDVVTITIDKLDHVHSYDEVTVTDPTCKAEGYTTHTCKCGDYYIDTYVERTAHTYEDVVIKEPTCTEQGEVREICSFCKAESYIKTPEKLGHSYNEIENTISDNNGYGYIVYECSRCEDVKTGYHIGWQDDVDGDLYNGETYEIKLLPEIDEKLLPYVKYTYQCGYYFSGPLENFDHIMTIVKDGTIRINIDDFTNIKTDDPLYVLIELQIEENPYNAYIEQGNRYFCYIANYRQNLAHQKVKNEVIPAIITENMTDAEKVLAVYEWICDNVQYDYDTYYENEKADLDSYWSIGPVLNGKAVCSGYADLFQKFMDLLEIPCLYIRSDTMNHAWNQVMLEGEWYWLDVTWDDNDIFDCCDYLSFLCSGTRVEDQEVSDLSKPPECAGTKGLGLIFEKYYASSKEEVINTLMEQKDKEKVYLVFHSEEEYRTYWINEFLNICRKDYEVKINSFASSMSRTVNDVYYDEYYIVSYKNTEEIKAVVEQEYKKQNCSVENHNWSEWITVKEATETEEGSRKRICSVCGEEETEAIPIVEHTHSYEEVVTEPTCTTQGYTTYTCSCGDSYIDNYIDKLEHECRWHLIKEVTCISDGEEELKCINCGHVENITIIGGGSIYHKWEYIITKDPGTAVHTTVDEFGERVRTCTYCNETKTEAIINIDASAYDETDLTYEPKEYLTFISDNVIQVCGTFCDDMAYETFEMVNELRTSLGLNELRWFEPYENICNIRGAEISVKFSHVRPNGGYAIYTNSAGMEFKLGENIAGGHRTAEKVFNGWYNSQGHYENMIKDRYTKYYASCFQDENGVCFWVQLFKS